MKAALVVLQFDEEVRSPSTAGLERVVYAPNEPILVMLDIFPGWEMETAMQFGSIPGRMHVHELGVLQRTDVYQGFAMPLRDVAEVWATAEGLGVDLATLLKRITELEDRVTGLRDHFDALSDLCGELVP